MKRHIVLAAVAAGIGLMGVPPGSAEPDPCASPGPTTTLDDVVVGLPRASGGGAVDVHFACDTLPPQRVREADVPGLDPVGADDEFGASLSRGSVSSASVPATGVLAIGSPGFGDDRGQVIVLTKTDNGYDLSSAVRIVGDAPGDRLGAVVSASDRELWASAPGETVAGAAGAGAVHHYALAPGMATPLPTISEATEGVPGGPEPGDHFGAALSAGGWSAVIGEPDEDVGGARDAGTVTVVSTEPPSGRLLSATTVSQNSAGVSGTAETGDRFGASVSGGVVGVPGEDVGRARDAGAVHVLRFRDDVDVTFTQVAFLTQESPRVPGASETGDQFGAAVQFGQIDGYRIGGDQGYENVVVGVPGEDLGAVRDAGDVLVFRYLDTTDTATTSYVGPLYRRGGLLGGTARAGDRVGQSLSRTLLPAGYAPPAQYGGASLVVPLPGATVEGRAGAGVVLVKTYDRSLLTYADSAGPTAGEGYGVPETVSPGDKFVTDCPDDSC